MALPDPARTSAITREAGRAALLGLRELSGGRPRTRALHATWDHGPRAQRGSAVFPGQTGGAIVKVGDTIWKLNGRFNLRWEPVAILGETSRSWLLPPNYSHTKVPKNGPHPGWAFSEQECDDWRWSHDYNWLIADAVQRCQDATKLRQIAEIIGWKPEAP